MPPYSSYQQDSAILEDDPFLYRSLKDDSYDIAAPPALSASHTQDKKTDPSTSVLEKMLDFNMCATPAIPNPSPSAVFKTRVCAECGCECGKFQGYKKEILFKRNESDSLFDEDRSMTFSCRSSSSIKNKKTKVYYHKRCHQIKQYRDEHKKNSGFQLVMGELLERVRMIELEAQRRAFLKTRAEKEGQERLFKEQERVTDNNDTAMNENVADIKKSDNKKTKFLKRTKNLFSLFSCKGNKSTIGAVNAGKSWKEYIDPATGKPYYSNGVTTTWEKPKSPVA